MCSLMPGWPAVVFTGFLAGQPFSCSLDAWLVSRYVHWVPGWPAVLFTGFLAGQPLCSLGTWLASRCVHWLPGRPAVVFVGFLAGQLIAVRHSVSQGFPVPSA